MPLLVALRLASIKRLAPIRRLWIIPLKADGTAGERDLRYSAPECDALLLRFGGPEDLLPPERWIGPASPSIPSNPVPRS